MSTGHVVWRDMYGEVVHRMPMNLENMVFLLSFALKVGTLVPVVDSATAVTIEGVNIAPSDVEKAMGPKSKPATVDEPLPVKAAKAKRKPGRKKRK